MAHLHAQPRYTVTPWVHFLRFLCVCWCHRGCHRWLCDKWPKSLLSLFPKKSLVLSRFEYLLSIGAIAWFCDALVHKSHEWERYYTETPQCLDFVLYYHIGVWNGTARLQNTKTGQGSTRWISAGEIPQANYPKNSRGSTLDWRACLHLWRIGSFAEIPGRTEVSYKTACKHF